MEGEFRLVYKGSDWPSTTIGPNAAMSLQRPDVVVAEVDDNYLGFFIAKPAGWELGQEVPDERWREALAFAAADAIEGLVRSGWEPSPVIRDRIIATELTIDADALGRLRDSAVPLPPLSEGLMFDLPTYRRFSHP